jgi:hypothetical protein
MQAPQMMQALQAPRALKRVLQQPQDTTKRMHCELEPPKRMFQAFINGQLCNLTYEEYMHSGF